MSAKKIAVLGAGNAARAMAGDMALRGHEVRLWESPAFEAGLKAIRESGNTLTLHGEVAGRAQLAVVTTDAAEAVRGADVVYCLMPSYGHATAFDAVAPHLEAGQSVLLMPGNFGSIQLRARLAARGLENDVLVGECDTIPYATRIQPDGTSLVFGLKDFMYIAAIPAARTDELIRRLAPVFPIELRAHDDVLTVGLANTNMILHCPTLLMNAGRVESGERFRFYNDGMTESVCRVMEAMDAERLAVGRALGCKLISEYEDAILNYGLARTEGERLYDLFKDHPVYGNHGPDSPTSMTNRYLSEDVPFLLVPLSELGRATGVPTPTVDAVITLAEAANGCSYRTAGRNLKNLRWKGLSPEEIKKAVRG
ncbi:NAD/NADP octopine/nopaline dehydrogenase family protein [Synergistaceae bacterium OttesenSCG-928-I11]|nr:NAD/NADP octopine/nopaline dehydrogenase family protein [Synergistaceae bacterium OttesenSCG-928-I11]